MSQNNETDINEALDEAMTELTAEPAEEPVETDTPDADGPERDEKGRFVGRSSDDGAEESADTPETVETEPDTQLEAGEDTTVQGGEQEFEPDIAPAIEPPVSWTPAAKAEWSKLPRLLQDEVMKREADVSRAFEQNAGKVRQSEELSAVLEPVRDQLQLNGISPAQYVQRLSAADRYLQTNPAEAIQWLANNYGIDLHNLTAQQADMDNLDPNTAALRQEVMGLKQYIQSEIQTREQQEKQRAANELEAFRNEVGADGKLKHPHMDQLRATMGGLMMAASNVGKTMTLEDAYNQAVYADPTIRAQLTAYEQAKQQRDRSEADAKKAQEAKRVSRTNIKGGAAAGKPTATTLDEMLQESFAEISAA